MKMIELTTGQIIRGDKYYIKTEIEKLKNNLKLISKPTLSESDKRINEEKINEELSKLSDELILLERTEKEKHLIKKVFIADKKGKQIIYG